MKTIRIVDNLTLDVYYGSLNTEAVDSCYWVDPAVVPIELDECSKSGADQIIIDINSLQSLGKRFSCKSEDKDRLLELSNQRNI